MLGLWYFFEFSTTLGMMSSDLVFSKSLCLEVAFFFCYNCSLMFR